MVFSLGILLPLFVHNCHSFEIKNSVWRKTYANRAIMNSGAANRSESRVAGSLLLCNLMANDMRWTHLMCYEEKSCFMADTKIYPSSNLSGIEDPLECMTDQFSFDFPTPTEAPTVLTTTLTSVQTTTEEPTTLTTTLTTTTVRPALIDSNFFVSSLTTYLTARDYCLNNNGKPFVPKSEEEYLFLISKVTGVVINTGWYPLNDLGTEGTEVYEDGTAFDTSSFNPTKWVPLNSNNNLLNCVTVTYIFNHAAWNGCLGLWSMLCLKNGV